MPGEVAAMPRAPNSAVPMTRAMSLGAGPAILIREPRRSYIAEHGAAGIRPQPPARDRAAGARLVDAGPLQAAWSWPKQTS
jgi:hypothetical protein